MKYPKNSYYNHRNFKRKKYLIRQQTTLKILETFAHSVYAFNEVNDFINKETPERTNFWGVENNFDVMDAFFSLGMIKDKNHKDDIRELALEIATHELACLHKQKLSKYKKRTAIIIEYSIREYVLSIQPR